MAKGNLFLGTAAKSVGDVVMYRREGSQVSRVRVRKIANPKTDAQCKQRAIMAPIPKFYSPLAIVLERSFEGLSKSKSYSKFLKTNADKARANDWLLPKTDSFFPLPYQLSQGSLAALGYTYDTAYKVVALGVSVGSASYTTVGGFSTMLTNVGYQNGDIVTIIGIKGDLTTRNFVASSIQFEIDTTSDATLESISNGQFDIMYDENYGMAIASEDEKIVGGAVIISRWENEKWRRSTQSLCVAPSIMTAINEDNAKKAAIESYKGAAADGNPLVYLDGDELQ